jgi:hypothetical protein
MTGVHRDTIMQKIRSVRKEIKSRAPKTAFRKEAKKQGLTLSEFVRQTLKNAVE